MKACTQGCPVQELQGCAVVGEGSMPLTGCSACLIEECTEASCVHEGVDTPVLTKRHLLPVVPAMVADMVPAVVADTVLVSWVTWFHAFE